MALRENLDRRAFLTRTSLAPFPFFPIFTIPSLPFLFSVDSRPPDGL
jgi:hypothetical protein